MNQKLAAIRHVALDMDGTIYRGDTLFASTDPFLSLLKDLGIGYTFLTNNPSKSITDYVEHLRDIGIVATEQQLYTSTQATIEYLHEEWPKIHRIFALGTPSMCEEFAAAGFVILPDSPNTSLAYERLCRAAWWISRGKPFFATNPDRVCPTDQLTVLVDCGSICAALEAATGHKPEAVLGKPDPAMIRGILHQHALQSYNLAMVGDRLYTDIAMARQAGALGVLVLTGETTAEQAAQASPAPDLVVPSLAEFGAKLKQAQKDRVPA